MFVRLVREALFHRDTDRRHTAAMLIAASPFASPARGRPAAPALRRRPRVVAWPAGQPRPLRVRRQPSCATGPARGRPHRARRHLGDAGARPPRLQPDLDLQVRESLDDAVVRARASQDVHAGHDRLARARAAVTLPRRRRPGSDRRPAGGWTSDLPCRAEAAVAQEPSSTSGAAAAQRCSQSPIGSSPDPDQRLVPEHRVRRAGGRQRECVARRPLHDRRLAAGSHDDRLRRSRTSCSCPRRWRGRCRRDVCRPRAAPPGPRRRVSRWAGRPGRRRRRPGPALAPAARSSWGSSGRGRRTATRCGPAGARRAARPAPPARRPPWCGRRRRSGWSAASSA